MISERRTSLTLIRSNTGTTSLLGYVSYFSVSYPEHYARSTFTVYNEYPCILGFGIYSLAEDVSMTLAEKSRVVISLRNISHAWTSIQKRNFGHAWTKRAAIAPALSGSVLHDGRKEIW